MANTAVPDKEVPLIEVINNAEDFTEAFHCTSEAFGRQARDAFWQAFNPGWETPEGQAAGAERMVQRWRSTTTDNKGNPNTLFLKATLPDPSQPGRRTIVGFATWVQKSAVEGYGDVSGDPSDTIDLEALHPGNKSEQRFLQQMCRSFFKRRLEYVKDKVTENPPAVMVLDLCATHPSVQRRGVASKLVTWGLDEARRRGIPEAITEASSMGRHVYKRLGFQPQGSDVVYEVDDEFANRDKPPNAERSLHEASSYVTVNDSSPPRILPVAVLTQQTFGPLYDLKSLNAQKTAMADGLGIGRLQAALASATNEVTVAAANINFDFALVKCEAPQEYRPLGQELSSHRKAEAEQGSLHITARRLGALFDGLCPNIPNLLGAFGTRATEISRAATAHSQVKTTDNWIFSDYAGIDSTSLWAAATSGKAALPLYLLACLLARAWDDADATSLWVEIVNERRRDIATRFQNGEPLPFAVTAAAAQQEISRDQLAKWDASARAWLKTADTVKLKQRKQFLLIANNISIPVNEETRPFASIIPAWITALESMEQLIAGNPQAVKNGSVLLGISAWHIYPDMIIFSEKAGGKPVTMRDPLVHPGGVISLGLSDSASRAARGVYWSLSLAHHKFYGRPVRKVSKINGDSSRLTIGELQVVAIGVILGKWHIPLSRTAETLRFLLQLACFLPSKPESYDDRWVEMITKPIMRFFEDEKLAAPLISLGRRRTSYLPTQGARGAEEPPFFGLTQVDVLLPLIETSDFRVQLLRRLAGRVAGLDSSETYIAFLNNEEWCLASAFPVDCSGIKNASALSTTNSQNSGRWRSHCCWMSDMKLESNPLHSELVLPAKQLPFEKTRTMIRMKDPDRKLLVLSGDADIAAIFVADQHMSTQKFQPPTVSYDDIVWAMQNGWLSASRIMEYLQRQRSDSNTLFFLDKLAFVSDIYKSLDATGATISPRVLLQPLCIANTQLKHSPKSAWDASYMSGSRRSHSAVGSALMVIAYCETGTGVSEITRFDPHQILGISSNDSIYVPSKILNDPEVQTPDCQFSRLLGNLGRPGLTVLTSPKELEVRDPDLGSWRQSMEMFDGSSVDYFASTSLHLSFTEWSRPLYQSASFGQRGSEVVHAEAVVSVRDAGVWVGDINIMRALSGVQTLPRPSQPCIHTQPSKPPAGMMSLENWEQVLDCPSGVVVTRSTGNWVARLALVAVLVQHCKLESKRIYVCPKDTCWGCVKPEEEHNVIYVY
ncbi:hypothetical protein HD806DRAFT_535367 [Xylariaceae sp. AK1471]|nr:hypothetical protein HD806DRAFT_535367 [Xylariaceae sp. AK1471]